jgi:hypothetical protein
MAGEKRRREALSIPEARRGAEASTARTSAPRGAAQAGLTEGAERSLQSARKRMSEDRISRRLCPIGLHVRMDQKASRSRRLRPTASSYPRWLSPLCRDAPQSDAPVGSWSGLYLNPGCSAHCHMVRTRRRRLMNEEISVCFRMAQGDERREAGCGPRMDGSPKLPLLWAVGAWEGRSVLPCTNRLELH